MNPAPGGGEDEDISLAIHQLRRRSGLMAKLGSEDGVVKLDWVEGVSRLLADDGALEAVEAEAENLLGGGIRHVIWAGMGGSIGAVRVLVDLGLFSPGTGSPAIYPLDSTDPAALNRIVEELARAGHLELPSAGSPPPAAWLRQLLDGVLMIGVAMGMTSEEPITHLEWFAGLLEDADLTVHEHLLVMALPGSYLAGFARARGIPTLQLQLDGGTGTGGRMSAPSTRVFLLPAALALISAGAGSLRSVLRRAWELYDLDGARKNPDNHQHARLAVALHEAATDGVVHLMLDLPEPWTALLPWIEQLMEESLGKAGKGVVVFKPQPLNQNGSAFDPRGTLSVSVAADSVSNNSSKVALPHLATTGPADLLATAATSFLGWQLTMALFGYLNRIVFAGQPAVEQYKARARRLREQASPLSTVSETCSAVRGDSLTLLPPAGVVPRDSPAATFSAALRPSVLPDYLDLTYNGEFPPGWEAALLRFGGAVNRKLGIPFKLRRAPAAYHSTEQSEMDGPPSLVSLRIVRRRQEPSIVGRYTCTFLHAQAVATWQAMVEAGRDCYLLIVDGSEEEGLFALESFFAGVRQTL